MPDYILDNDIPIPEDLDNEVLDPEIEPENTSKFTPFKPNLKRCHPLGSCRPNIGRCSVCGDVFPCPSGNCGHWDCANPRAFGFECDGNGTELPELLDVIDNMPLARISSGEISFSLEDSEGDLSS